MSLLASQINIYDKAGCVMEVSAWKVWRQWCLPFFKKESRGKGWVLRVPFIWAAIDVRYYWPSPFYYSPRRVLLEVVIWWSRGGRPYAEGMKLYHHSKSWEWNPSVPSRFIN